MPNRWAQPSSRRRSGWLVALGAVIVLSGPSAGPTVTAGHRNAPASTPSPRTTGPAATGQAATGQAATGQASPAAGPIAVTSGPAADPDSGDDEQARTDGVDALAENRNAGTDKWLIAGSPDGTKIEGYAGQVSVLAGQPVDLYVSSTAPTFRIEVLRTGSYDGHLARRIYAGPSLPGGQQAHTATDPVTRMVSAQWRPSTALATAGWLPGAYLVKLIGADGAQAYIPVVVRDQHSTGALLLVDSTATWQAYNGWGGPSTYRGNRAPGTAADIDERAYAASYDRPYDREHGAAGFLATELPAIAAAERLGLRLNYATDIDLQLHPEVLDGAVGVALLGHSEYWSRTMRANLTAARDRGVNLAFLGANDVHRRIRLQSSPIGPGRVMVNYKLGTLDPVRTADTTADWGKAPFPDPQSSLVGPMFKCAHARADLVLTDPGVWVFRGLGQVTGTNLPVGTRLPGMVGPEFDRVMTWVTTPRPIQVLAHSPAVCQGKPEFSDMTWYSAPSGAGVFDAGTLDWVAGMDSPDPLTRRVVTTATERVLKMIASPLAGQVQPADDNVDQIYGPDGKAIPPAGTSSPEIAPEGAS